MSGRRQGINAPISCQRVRKTILVYDMRARLTKTTHDLNPHIHQTHRAIEKTTLTFAPSPFSISTNKLPASSPCSVRTSTNVAQRFRIFSEDFLTPPEPSTVPLGPAPPLPCTSLFPPGPALPEPASAGLSLPAAALELRSPVRVPTALPAPPAVGSFPLTNAWSDICFKLLESGGSFDTEADLCLVDDIFDFATAPVSFGGRSLERTVLEGGGISATSDEGPATAPVVAVGTNKHREYLLRMKIKRAHRCPLPSTVVS